MFLDSFWIAAPTDAELLDAHNKRSTNTKTTILDSVKNLFVAHRADKTTNKEMSRALISFAKQALGHTDVPRQIMWRATWMGSQI
jgi:hypothetical protein